jgi:antitoxin (DNA-binding transcriptional repressor) of toxin-antitoxin stability system
LRNWKVKNLTETLAATSDLAFGFYFRIDIALGIRGTDLGITDKKAAAQIDGGDTMTTIDIKKGTLEGCVSKAQSQRVVVTRKGAPVALVVGLEGLDKKQIELGSSDKFWKFIQSRRRQKTVSRAEVTHSSSVKAKKKRRR